ncbi:MAG: hypothetical protein WC774_01245 [Candidatus Gracilibacteria bacterium]
MSPFRGKPTIKELSELFEKSKGDIDFIAAKRQEIEELVDSASSSEALLSSDTGILEKCKTALVEIQGKVNEIESLYEDLLVDNEEGDSTSTQIEEFFETVRLEKEAIESFSKKLFGEKNDDGSGKKTDGLSDDIENFYREQQVKYNELYTKIENELLSGATTANLAGIFSKKVQEYYRGAMAWSVSFLVLLGYAVYYFGSNIPGITKDTTPTEVLLNLLVHAPIMIAGVWLAMFIGNRRAENKKLEESYKHKEIMARTFVGYRESISEIDDKDNTLILKHMENLLDALKVNSSDFLNSKGDNHPIREVLSNVSVKTPFLETNASTSEVK